ncbi:hypothetical protein F7725_020590 [Dissostichus mawsoni]|uniref:DDHD domain-containing protein n=1 Tax=Dissostichus mawsoni TaxID=36200 RepID=A0A7J5YDM2_DISMA|nr:hypothetical protein F7725_020590 [Dissostichus mawsoni]
MVLFGGTLTDVNGAERHVNQLRTETISQSMSAAACSDGLDTDRRRQTAEDTMSKEARGRGSARKHSATHWCLQNIAQESVDSSDEEFFDARADVMEGKSAILLGMSQWNSNDLVEQIETMGHMEDQSHEGLYQLGGPRCAPQSSIDGLEDIERKCKTHVLLLVVHGGNILDTAGGDPSTKSGDVDTLTSVLEKVTRAHFQAAAEHVKIKLVPCPAVCAEAFSLVSNLNPYSYDESCVSSSVDHLPLAALPLLAIVSPRYQDAVATVIARANQVYRSFLESEDGQGFTGQVCLMGDCVGGVLCFDALCFSNHQRPGSPNNSSKNNSTESLKDNLGLLGESSLGLSSSKRLSKSNIDISAPNEGHSQSGPPLSRKQSDSYDGDTSSTGQHSFFSSLMKDSVEVCGGSGSSLVLNPDCFLLGCPLGLVLAMRRTVLPTVQVSQLHPACSQIFNLFYPSDPSASRLEPLLQPLFHKLPPFAVPRYQRYPLGDGRSMLIVNCYMIKAFPYPPFCLSFSLLFSPSLAESIQSHPNVFLEGGKTPGGPASQTSSETKPEGGVEEGGRRASVTSVESEMSICFMGQLGNTITNISSSWWGSKRLDYALYCPDVLTAFPTVALPHLFHASYWESTDVAAFVLRQLMRCDSLKTQEADSLGSTSFSPSSPRENGSEGGHITSLPTTG